MSRDQKQDDSFLTGREQLLAYFQSGAKPRDARGIGTEHEKFVWDAKTGRLIGFDRIEWILNNVADRFGWERGYDGDRVVALERGDEAISLEPGGQFELSGGIKRTIHETEEELDRHFDELAAVVGDDVIFTCWGMNPYDELDDIEWVPKSRYAIMREYLPTKGDRAHWMMKLTCTIQANMDFTSEADAVSILRLGYLASPFVHALFANSPIDRGEVNGYQSMRGHIWTRMDNDRSGVPPFVLNDSWGFEDYLEWVLDVPMFFIRRDGKYINMAGHSFRAFMLEGYQGHRATMGDFELHLSTAFPEVRLKRYIEVRCGDGGPRSHMLALPALWKGLLYDDQAREEALALVALDDIAELRSLYEVASKDGIHGRTQRVVFIDVARKLVEIARAGLDRIADQHGHESEAPYLSVLETILDRKESEADRFLMAFEAHPARLAVIRAFDLMR
ncbi:MAG: glutamate-cysteine ligase family protein [bacterium]